MSRLGDPIELLAALVRIPSVNPDGDPGTDRTGEAEMAACLGSLLEDLGARVTFEDVRPGRPNVIGRFYDPDGPRTKRRILLGPHTDTVSVAGMSIDPFAGEVRDGKLFGRGACDTKGSIAAMLHALGALGGADRIARLGCDIAFVGFMGEESNQYGSRHFAKRHADEFDFAIVGEPTGCRIVAKHKGALWVTLTARGISAHGSRPELGRSAILTMLGALNWIETDFRAAITSDEFSDPLLGRSTINIGMISGGTRTNIVPAYCMAKIDIRMTPALHRREPLAMLEAGLGAIDPEITIETLPPCAPLDTDPDHPFVRQLADLGVGIDGAPWFCDAARLASAGLPSIAFGPGDIAQAHTEDEFVETEQLEKCSELLQAFLRGAS